jgi:S-adenosylhomocysteine hydrolase
MRGLGRFQAILVTGGGMGRGIDKLAKEQTKYLASWDVGT